MSHTLGQMGLLTRRRIGEQGTGESGLGSLIHGLAELVSGKQPN
jgi:hypothetical protein